MTKDVNELEENNLSDTDLQGENRIFETDDGDATGQISFKVEDGDEGEKELPLLPLEEMPAAIEAILFTMGNSVDIMSICHALGAEKKQVMSVLNQMQEEYLSSKRGIMIMYLEDKVQLCTKREYYEYLIRITVQPHKQVLTEVMLETLSIIAYKQPVTKVDIERIRGVKSDFSVNKLVEYGLIEEVGRLDAPGRPMLFATTEEFLRRFGMDSVNQLPTMDASVVDVLREEAEGEVDGEIEVTV